ncbi:MAG: ATP-binding protein [Planctomycetes bacterium]|nr:ATP-binding protein [Planctomycetota bacterium]
MQIAIASGKGGTGKTTIATNLAWSVSSHRPTRLLDCDVEEPNCHIFLNPEIEKTDTVGVPVPLVDTEKCTGCGKCGELCQYSAIVSMKSKPLTFPELCHGCGGCSLVCPADAITEVDREVGVVESGKAGKLKFVRGLLRIGEAMSPPLIRAVKTFIDEDLLTIIDAPPGTSCPVIEAIRGVDYVILVTEPTPFGLNDLILAVETVRQLRIPFGVIVNRAGIGDQEVQAYCEKEKIPILLELPDDRRIAEAYSRGEMAVNAIAGLQDKFNSLYAELAEYLNEY